MGSQESRGSRDSQGKEIPKAKDIIDFKKQLNEIQEEILRIDESCKEQSQGP